MVHFAGIVPNGTSEDTNARFQRRRDERGETTKAVDQPGGEEHFEDGRYQRSVPRTRVDDSPGEHRVSGVLRLVRMDPREAETGRRAEGEL